MTLGQIIREERLKRGETQEELAHSLGTSRQTVINWEKERHLPDSDSLTRLARHYQLSLDKILGLGETHSNSPKWQIYSLLLLLILLGFLVDLNLSLIIPAAMAVLLLIGLLKEFY